MDKVWGGLALSLAAWEKSGALVNIELHNGKVVVAHLLAVSGQWLQLKEGENHHACIYIPFTAINCITCGS